MEVRSTHPPTYPIIHPNPFLKHIIQTALFSSTHTTTQPLTHPPSLPLPYPPTHPPTHPPIQKWFSRNPGRSNQAGTSSLLFSPTYLLFLSLTTHPPTHPPSLPLPNPPTHPFNHFFPFLKVVLAESRELEAGWNIVSRVAGKMPKVATPPPAAVKGNPPTHPLTHHPPI